MDSQIEISYNKQTVFIVAPVKDSLHASMLADRLNGLPYLKVNDRIYKNDKAEIKAYIIKGLFKIETLQNDLESLSSIMNLEQ